MRLATTTMAATYKFVDIAANLTDPMYSGTYHGSSRHPPDLDSVLSRAWKEGVEKIMVTGGSLVDSESAVALAKKNDRLQATVGCHPTRCGEFDPDPDAYFQSLSQLIRENRDKVAAVGECGLDYARTQFCDKETQKKYFSRQLDLVTLHGLPLFLHLRDAAKDLIQILGDHPEKDKFKGVVHSYDGSEEDAKILIEMGFYIGINGCSLKTEENLEVVKALPTSRLMLETDSPWCDLRKTHAGTKYAKTDLTERYPAVKKEKWKPDAMVKSRNEPVTILNILEIVSAVKGEDPKAVSDTIYENSCRVFFDEK